MTIEELKAEADRHGYKLTKKLPSMKVKKHCNVKPHEWLWAGEGWYYECPVCGLKTDPEPVAKKAMEKWNQLVGE